MKKQTTDNTDLKDFHGLIRFISVIRVPFRKI